MLLLFALCLSASVESWSYSAGGRDWKGVCAKGVRQSPINIPFVQTYDFSKITHDHLKVQFELGESEGFVVENDGNKITFMFDDDEEVTSAIRVPVVGGLLDGVLGDGDKSAANTEYVPAFLYSFQLRLPSEHTYDGMFSPAEGQMFMVILKEHFPSCPQQACLTIINFPFQYTAKDQENPFLSNVLSQIGGEWPVPGESIPAITVNATIDFSQLIPKTGNPTPAYAVYSGSLTTPPCTENVLQIVMEHALPISVQQVKELEDVITAEDGVAKNSRAIQPLNGRTIGYVGGPQEM